MDERGHRDLSARLFGRPSEVRPTGGEPSGATSTEGEETEVPGGAAKLGRRIAAAIYWALTAYILGAGFVSVVPQVFWPAEASNISSFGDSSDCPAALAALYRDLMDGAAERLRTPRSGATQSWLDRWDRRYRDLQGACGHLRSYSLLARLRYGLEEDLLRFEAFRLDLADETLAALEREGATGEH
jgi:hypothetical protein